MNALELQVKWEKQCTAFLEGKTIKRVFYLNKMDAQAMEWDNRPLVIQFTDGSYIYPSIDDEGNDGGALFTSDKELQVIPVMRNY